MSKAMNNTKARIWKSAAMVAVMVGLMMSVGCGFKMGGGSVCETLINNVCQRIAECYSNDTVTQDEFYAQCKRTYDPQRSCEYLSNSQQQEMNAIERTGCHEDVKLCTCTSDGKVSCSATCNTAINNALGAISGSQG